VLLRTPPLVTALLETMATLSETAAAETTSAAADAATGGGIIGDNGDIVGWGLASGLGASSSARGGGNVVAANCVGVLLALRRVATEEFVDSDLKEVEVEQAVRSALLKVISTGELQQPPRWRPRPLPWFTCPPVNTADTANTASTSNKERGTSLSVAALELALEATEDETQRTLAEIGAFVALLQNEVLGGVW